MMLPFLLEIGTEEIPDWMIPGAMANLGELFQAVGVPHTLLRLDATPRRRLARTPAR